MFYRITKFWTFFVHTHKKEHTYDQTVYPVGLYMVGFNLETERFNSYIINTAVYEWDLSFQP